MDIPPEIQINATIRPGSVYKFSDSALTSPLAHYFIVLNHNPIDDHLLVLVCSSTKLAKTKWHNRYYPPSTLVDISPTEYSEFDFDSIINCNEVFIRTKQELINKLSLKELELKTELSMGLVEKLRIGVLDSPKVAPAQKRILRQ